MVLVLAGFFDGISDNWVHGAVLWAAAGAVAWQARQERRADPSAAVTTPRLWGDHGSPPRGRAALMTVLALAYAVVVGSWHRYTWPTTAAVLVPTLVLMLIGWRAPVRGRLMPSRSPGSARPWVALGVAAGLWELLALVGQPSLTEGSYDHPTFSFLMDSVLANHLGRTLTLLAWLALGWFLITNSSATSPSAAEDPAPEVSRDLA